MTRARGWITFLIVVAISGRAAAQGVAPPDGPRVGDRGHVAVSVERLFGFDYSAESSSMNGMTSDTTHLTSFSAFGNPAAGIYAPASYPRVAVDGFVLRGLSIGAGLAIFRYSATSGSGLDQTEFTFTGLQITPRIGYLVGISQRLSIWPRAGIGLLYGSGDDTFNQGMQSSSNTSTGVTATVEVPFLLTVVPRAAVTFGPTLDASLYGRATSSTGATSSTTDQKLTAVGVQVGLLLLL